ncbi:MAG: hypothetical protein ACK4PK_00235 [Alphaproteobacteria bacterium]
MSQSKVITAVFDTRAAADSAIYKLEHAGYSEKEITLLISEDTRGKHFGIETGSKAGDGAATGAAIGGLTGAIGLALASAGTLLIPGLNLVVSGVLIGGLVGLGAGAATGGLIGALIGQGIPEHEAKLYEEAVRKGGILIAVESKDDAGTQRVKDILSGADAKDVMSRAA